MGNVTRGVHNLQQTGSGFRKRDLSPLSNILCNRV